MAKTHADCGYLLRDYIDGIPLDVASRMLPARTRLSFGLQLHLHWHGRMIARHQATQKTRGKEESSNSAREVRMPTNRLQAYLENLRSLIAGLRPKCGS